MSRLVSESFSEAEVSQIILVTISSSRLCCKGHCNRLCLLVTVLVCPGSYPVVLVIETFNAAEPSGPGVAPFTSTQLAMARQFPIPIKCMFCLLTYSLNRCGNLFHDQ
mmetsp:Transcript_87151/g.202893  ORF Transcript_87151/g.202893 Transcript_87151/m.202893 type:complete len:108 (-) Transcript_87151:1-324(-)